MISSRTFTLITSLTTAKSAKNDLKITFSFDTRRLVKLKIVLAMHSVLQKKPLNQNHYFIM